MPTSWWCNPLQHPRNAPLMGRVSGADLSGSAIDKGSDVSRGTVWMFDDVTAERQAAELMREARDFGARRKRA
jgi:hypothetical protein